MRVIEDHRVPGDADGYLFCVIADDGPGHGGAHHRYILRVRGNGGRTLKQINFQNGPVAEVGANGVTDAQLLAVLIDRLRCFQKGPYACRENAIALTHLEEALMWQQQRTISRLRRGVEGTGEV